jgi:putative redox protein
MSRSVYVNSGELKFAQNVTVGLHAMQADEPIEYGGNDAGPDPHEFLLAALGACASTTVQMYAERKQWPVEGVQVHLSYAKVPGKDRTEAAGTTVDEIEMEISFYGDLSNDQRRRLFEIAGRCPVHRMLSSPVKIQTKLLAPRSDRQDAGVQHVR